MGKTDKNLPSIAVLLGIISALFLSQIFSENFRIKILNVFRTPLKIISGSYYVLRDVAGFKELTCENKILKENMENMKREMLELHEMRLENRRLRELLNFTESENRKVLPSMVIARDPLTLRDIIVIDKGKRHGLRKDMTVISGNGLVGRVRETGTSISRVLLITDRDSVVSGILSRTRDEGAVTGMGNGLVMKYLELGCDVKEGDKVVTSGFSGIFEKGLLIGEVVSVKEDAKGLYLNAIIKPEVDTVRLEEVLVIK